MKARAEVGRGEDPLGDPGSELLLGGSASGARIINGMKKKKMLQRYIITIITHSTPIFFRVFFLYVSILLSKRIFFTDYLFLVQ